MTSAHTPGPWSVWGGVSIGTANHDVAIPTALPERAANSRLIAAAPELLDALRTTAGNIRSLGPAGAIPFEYEEWLAVVESAIAKAEVRS